MSYKLTVSLHEPNIVAKIKKYAKARGVSVSSMVEDYFSNLIKVSEVEKAKDYSLPQELDDLIGSLHISNEFKNKTYKELKSKMYEDRTAKYL